MLKVSSTATTTVTTAKSEARWRRYHVDVKCAFLSSFLSGYSLFLKPMWYTRFLTQRRKKETEAVPEKFPPTSCSSRYQYWQSPSTEVDSDLRFGARARSERTKRGLGSLVLVPSHTMGFVVVSSVVPPDRLWGRCSVRSRKVKSSQARWRSASHPRAQHHVVFGVPAVASRATPCVTLLTVIECCRWIWLVQLFLKT